MTRRKRLVEVVTFWGARALVVAVVAAAPPAVSGLGGAHRLLAQSLALDTGAPAFEVASVKPNKSIDGRRGASFAPGRFTQTYVTLRQLIQMAYSRRPFDVREIAGGPGWLDSERFDIVAKAEGDLKRLYLPDGTGSPGLAYVMLRTLLSERFKLVVHAETRELPVYALTIARRDGTLGPDLRRTDIDCAAVLDAMAASGGKAAPATPADPGQAPPCSVWPRPGHLTGHAISMSQLADVLSASVNRVVVDRTRLAGLYDLDLEWAPDRPSLPPDGTGVNDRPGDSNVSIFTALQEQLGLKLESTRAAVDVVVIDRAEPPTPD